MVTEIAEMDTYIDKCKQKNQINFAKINLIVDICRYSTAVAYLPESKTIAFYGGRQM